MKHRQFLKKMLIPVYVLLTVLLLTGVSPADMTIKGKVISSAKSEVKIDYKGDHAPNVGDPVEIGFKLGEDFIPVEGKWTISKVTFKYAWAKVESPAGEAPAVDYLVVIYSASPGNRAELNSKDKGGGGKGKSGSKKDLPPRAELRQKACDGGNAKACRNLGYMYQNGDGLEQNYGKAMQLYKEGCEKGSAEACNDVGVLYQKGWGVDKNSRQSVKFFRKACDGGLAMGCSNLGYRYQIGDGVQKDLRQASELYRKACNGGFEKGCRRLDSLQQ
jgi:hypothetical protein